MNIDTLFIEESVRGGWTHEAKITYADLAALANGNTTTFNLAVLPSATQTSGAPAADVFGYVTLYLKTPFVYSDGTLVSSTFAVGDSTNGAGSDLAATECDAAGSYVTAKQGTTWAAYTSALTKQVTVTGTALKNLNTATAGEVHILFTWVPLSQIAKD